MCHAAEHAATRADTGDTWCGAAVGDPCFWQPPSLPPGAAGKVSWRAEDVLRHVGRRATAPRQGDVTFRRASQPRGGGRRSPAGPIRCFRLTPAYTCPLVPSTGTAVTQQSGPGWVSPAFGLGLRGRAPECVFLAFVAEWWGGGFILSLKRVPGAGDPSRKPPVGAPSPPAS